VLEISLNRGGNLAVETLESNSASHRDKVGSLVSVASWDGSAVTKGGSVIPNTNSGTKFSKLTIIGESSNDVGELERGTIGKGTVDSWALSKETDKAIGKWQHHLRGEANTRSCSVVISEILGILVLYKLGIGEHAAPRRKFTGDLRLETTKVRHD